MAYTFTKAESDLPLIADGDYEAIIEKMEIKTLPTSGKEKIAITFRIRSDVEQEAKKRIVYDDIWKEKDNPQYFNRKRLNQLMGTQDIKDGTVFDTIKDVMNALQGGAIIIHVGHEMDTFRGKEINRVKWYSSSRFKPQSIGAKPADASPASEPSPEVEDEDLPF